MLANARRISRVMGEARRRGVFRAAALYSGVAFIVWQVADIALPALGAPTWAMATLVVAAITGFPFVLVVAWMYDLHHGRLLPASGLLRALDTVNWTADPGGVPVPEELTPLVGREAEIRELLHLFESKNHRLLSIVGPGGIGKTRLAMHVARLLKPRFPDGIFFAALDDVTAHDSLVSEVGRALGLRRESAGDQMDRVLFFLADRTALLFLDGFEGLSSSEDVVTRILEASPATTVLVTTRVPLSIRGEAVYGLAGMRCLSGPDGRIDGLELFREAALRHDPTRPLESAADPWILRICELVDGSPLGLELAASWTGAFSPKAIAEELESGGEFLEARDHDVPERQRSLGAVLDYTWRRLGKEARQTLSRVAVFETAFSLDGARSVCSEGVGALQSLIDISCLRRRPDGLFLLPRTLRQHARLHTPDWPSPELAERHAAHVAEALVIGVAELRAAGHDASVRRLEELLPDFVRAWRTAEGNPDGRLLEAMVQPLRQVLEASGRLSLGKELYSSALRNAAALEESTARPEAARLKGHLLGLQGYFERLSGDLGAAVRQLHSSVEVLKPLGQTKELAFALNALGDISAVLGRYEDARRFCARARALFNEVGDELGVVASSNNLGVVAQRLGDTEGALKRYTECLEVCQRLGDRYGSGYALNNLGVLHHEDGRIADARDCYEGALRESESVADRHGIASALANLSRLDLRTGLLDAGAEKASRARSIFDEMGDPIGICVCDLSLGDLSFAGGEDAAAGRAYRAALTVALHKGADPLLGEALIGVAELLAREGRSSEALEALVPTIACESLDQDAAERRDRLLAALAPDGSATSYRSASLHEVARKILS